MRCSKADAIWVTVKETQNKCLIPARTPVNQSIFGHIRPPRESWGPSRGPFGRPRGTSVPTAAAGRPPRRPQELRLPPGPGAHGQVGAGEQGGDTHSPSSRCCGSAPSRSRRCAWRSGRGACPRARRPRLRSSRRARRAAASFEGPIATRQPAPEGRGSERTSSRLATPRQAASAWQRPPSSPHEPVRLAGVGHAVPAPREVADRGRVVAGVLVGDVGQVRPAPRGARPGRRLGGPGLPAAPARRRSRWLN